jgi:hypothetical protein
MTIYEKYEALKREFIIKNPQATGDEYEVQIALIAKRLGL